MGRPDIGAIGCIDIPPVGAIGTPPIIGGCIACKRKQLTLFTKVWFTKVKLMLMSSEKLTPWDHGIISWRLVLEMDHSTMLLSSINITWCFNEADMWLTFPIMKKINRWVNDLGGGRRGGAGVRWVDDPCLNNKQDTLVSERWLQKKKYRYRDRHQLKTW